MKRLFIFLLMVNCLFCAKNSHGSHNRAGVITYKHLGGNTYEFTVFTCTKASSPADRDFLEIFWDPITSDTIYRVNGPDINPANGNPDGEIIGNDTKYNEYIISHAFPGAGIYKVFVLDPNRNSGVVNM